MRLTDDAPRILEALRTIEGTTVASAWPREETRGSVLLVTLAASNTADRRDDAAYLVELEYYVRVFAARAEETRRVCAAVHAQMEGLGYELTFRYEEPGEGCRQTVLRYRIYQKQEE